MPRILTSRQKKERYGFRGDVLDWLQAFPDSNGVGLALRRKVNRIASMKFFAALMIWLAMLAVVAASIVLAVEGKPWLLVFSLLAFIVAVGKIGCATHS